MALSAGTRLGPYEILSPLGAGGMGEVYKARDTRLDRTVAIKVLPEGYDADPQFRERFDREARAVAALNHPHICTVHDVGKEQGTAYLVMELLAGETLQTRLQRGALSIEDTLRIGADVASGLEAAHRAGIVHRDLKPANIMLTKGGAKLLDFGLAKTGGPVAAAAGLSMLPTTPPNLTAHGAILGTFQYMAPEQIEGQEADARSDIFSFGAVVYEMLTGKRAFEGKSPASLMAAILERDPAPMSALVPLAPPLLDRVVKRCLAKDPDERWQSATDLLAELQWIAADAGEPHRGARAGVKAARAGARRAWLVAGVFALAFAASVAALVFLFLRARPAPAGTPTARFAVPTQTATTWFALSPDGRSLAYVDGPGSGQLYVRAIDSLESRALAGTAGAQAPFWSPDSQSIGFFAGQSLMRVSVSGGAPHTVCAVPGSRVPGASWSDDDVMLFGRDGSLYQVSAGGGAPQLVARPSAASTYRFPQFLPHSRRFLYFEYSTRNAAESAIYAASLDSPLKTRVVNADYQARFVDAGYLFLIRNGDLVAQPVDAGSIALTGEPIVVAGQVLVDPNLNFRTAAFSVSSAGSFVYGTGSQPKTRLVWFDRRGNQGRTLGTPDAGYAAELSPDGSQVALELMDPEGRGHLWVMDVERGTKRALARTAGVWEYGPHWSPDGRFLAYAATSVRLTASLRRRPADGSGVEEVLAPESPLVKFVSHWSVDGRFVLFSTTDGLSMLSLADRRVSPVPQTRAGESLQRLSPDGQWLAYVSNESDRDEVYVRPLAGGQKILVSTEGGSYPYWRRDGRELYYVAPGDTMMAVSVSATGQLKVGAPQLLFRLPRTAAGRSPYSTIDGERFLVRTSESDAASSLTWVLNWPALLKKP